MPKIDAYRIDSNTIDGLVPTIFYPTMFSNLRLWLDVSRLVGYTDGQQITQLDDYSGNGFHATQGTAGYRAIYKPNILNGRPVARFDGGDDFYNLTSGAIPYGNESYSVFVVVKENGLNNRGFIGAGVANANNANCFRFAGNTTFNYWWSNDHQSSAVLSAGTFYFISFMYNNSSGREVFINGTSRGTNSSTARNTTNSNNVIGKTIVGENWDGDIAEIIIYNRALSSTERQTVENYLRTKYYL